jgi:hypothetical protein
MIGWHNRSIILVGVGAISACSSRQDEEKLHTKRKNKRCGLKVAVERKEDQEWV